MPSSNYREIKGEQNKKKFIALSLLVVEKNVPKYWKF